MDDEMIEAGRIGIFLGHEPEEEYEQDVPINLQLETLQKFIAKRANPEQFENGQAVMYDDLSWRGMRYGAAPAVFVRYVPPEDSLSVMEQIGDHSFEKWSVSNVDRVFDCVIAHCAERDGILQVVTFLEDSRHLKKFDRAELEARAAHVAVTERKSTLQN